MNGLAAFAETLVSRSHGSSGDSSSSSWCEDHAPSTTVLVAATVCLIWYAVVSVVCAVGCTQLWRHYSSPPPPPPPPPTRLPRKSTDADDVPHVTIIRPIKGLEPSLYECLGSTFRQDYPKDKLTINLCVSDRQDAANAVLQRLLKDFPDFDVKLLVEDEDPMLQGEEAQRLGPNPKIRNMSRAYREAKGDIVWIIDCNVWVSRGACGRMVDTLVGKRGIRNKFVHLLPLVVDIAGTPVPTERNPSQQQQQHQQQLLDGEHNPEDDEGTTVASTSTSAQQLVTPHTWNMWQDGGGRIEEVFMSSSHAKFYTAINTVLIAPCIVGKSTMFRRSHLDALTSNQGIDFFSQNICEDHLIGDLLWRKPLPSEQTPSSSERWGKHALVFGDLAIQPMARMSVREYIARRVRWLRVRKFTVALATLVEPGTESFLCSLYGAFAFTHHPFFTHLLCRFAPTLPPAAAFAGFWLTSVALWCAADRALYNKLHSANSVEVDGDTPAFARPPRGGLRRPLGVWLAAWVAREVLAWPVWAWAVFGGATVVWRGKRFWVGVDMKVHEICGGEGEGKGKAPVTGNGHVDGSAEGEAPCERSGLLKKRVH